jgi:hypothetical protein
MFMKKLDFTVDLAQINLDLDEILTKTTWEPGNQIGITHRKNTDRDLWKDSMGGSMNRVTKERYFSEEDFSEFNSAIPSYTRSIVEKFAESQNFIPGRVRFMRLIPNTGLSLHDDETVRYHLVISTNPAAYIAKGSFTASSAICYHMPADSHFYLVDTRLPHFVYNAGMTDRVHLVICPINIENKE